MYMKLKSSDANYEYFDALCWCGHITENAMVWPMDELIECERCKSSMPWNKCIILTHDEWERITDFGEMRDCHDCGAKPGEFHMAGCDTERCPLCGGQLLSCGCYYEMEEYESSEEDEGHITMRVEEENKLHRILQEKVGLLPWDGEWPGVKEARLYNLYCYWGPPWVECSKDHPQAREDLNSVYTKCRWNPEMKHFQLIGENKTYEEMLEDLPKELRDFYEAYRNAVRSLAKSSQESQEEKEEYHHSV